MQKNGIGHAHQNHQQSSLNGDDNHETATNGDVNRPSTPTLPSQSHHLEIGHVKPDEEPAPSKKRKLADISTQSRQAPRPISPPWKKIAVEGPTSFVEGGRRKSSRTNQVPLELQPQADKRQTRAARQQVPPIKSRYSGTAVLDGDTAKSATGSLQQHGHSVKALPRPGTSSDKISPVKSKLHHVTTQETVTQSTPFKRSHKKQKPPDVPNPRSVKKESTSPVQSRRGKRLSESDSAPPRPSNALGKRPKVYGRALKREEDESALSEDSDSDEEDDGPVEIGPNFRHQQVKFKVKMPTLSVQHPGHVLQPKKFASFRDWLQSDDPLAEEPSGRRSDKQIRRDANIRARIIKASKPGGLLTPEKCSLYEPDPQEEPPQQYGHQDHLVAHALYFRKLMHKEHREHAAMAKRLAYAAVPFWQRSQPVPEVEEEDRTWQVAAALVMRELSAKLKLVRDEVESERLKRWEKEQSKMETQALNKVLDHSTKMLRKRRRRGTDDEGSVLDEDETSGSTGEDSGMDEDSEDEANMSSSQSESDDGLHSKVVDEDEKLTQAELRRKYDMGPTSNLDRPPDKTEESSIPMDQMNVEMVVPAREPSGVIPEPSPNPPMESVDPSSVTVDDVDAVMLDDSEESTDMEDDMGDSDEDDDEEDEESEGEDSEDDSDTQPGLLGFLSKGEVKAAEQPPPVTQKSALQPEQNPVQRHIPESTKTQAIIPLPDDYYSEEELEEVSLIGDPIQVQTPSLSNSEAASIDANADAKASAESPATVATSFDEPDKLECPVATAPSPNKPSPLSIITSTEEPLEVKVEMAREHESLPPTPVSSKPLKTRVPSLIRGTLREYQHYGLDWLAGLYDNKTNGILADEMGLGKTLQTIALLAHLAVEHHIWGPHLIIVPTSVMINWEVEFRKFLPGFKVLTYYGSIDERRKKRVGWGDDDKWNIVITSYQLVIQDHTSFKKRNWHYLVLDEAHNIKNFRSQRWQTLLTFKTQARLLLTGTPLQNNLDELWSLVFFLMPSGFAGLDEFTSWFKKPVDQILEQGKEMDEEAKQIVRRLHGVLRPYLLRRLKADVEKQMPGKYEHVVYCKLSKRQRYLYDGFMGRAKTKEALASSNYLSIVNCLMQLRKVCNHPDLFETRQIVTSHAMPKSAIADFEIKELLVRRKLLQKDPWHQVNLDVINLLPGANGPISALHTIQPSRLGALGRLRHLEVHQFKSVQSGAEHEYSTVSSSLLAMKESSRKSTYERLHQWAHLTSLRSQRRPLLSYQAAELVRIDLKTLPHRPEPKSVALQSQWFLDLSPAMQDMVLSLPKRSEACQTMVKKFACITPAVVAPGLTRASLTQRGIQTVQAAKKGCTEDAFHEARMRLSIAFPDNRLLQYDCGKLQKLHALLSERIAGGHRALIFTQMAKVLDILEQFLNIHGHRYLRLDGATKVESRQILADRFNNDDRIPIFILSSRAGGQGLNLTGADTVIFYDMDWNPQMDAQCQDRCHRIGQTRDVHIYRLVNDHTIEKNILRTANRKRMLDNIIIQAGDFTTDHFNNPNAKGIYDDDDMHDGNDAAGAAMDRVLGTDGGMSRKVFEQVEDQEDVAAARVAEKEIVPSDAADFTEKVDSAVPTNTPAATPRDTQGGMAAAAAEESRGGAKIEVIEDRPARNIDDYCIRFMEWELRDVVIEPKVDKSKKAKKGGEAHRVKRAR